MQKTELVRPRKYPPPAELVTLLLAFVSVALIGVLSYNEWTAYRRLGDEIEVTQSIAASTAALRSALGFAEIEQRGFLLTGEADYIDRYRQAIDRISAASKTLEGAAQSRADQDARQQELEKLVEAKIGELQNGIEIRTQKGFFQALGTIRSERGEATMDHIQSLCGELERVADARLSRLSREGSDAVTQARLISTSGSALLLGLIVIATITIERGIRRRDQLYREAQHARERAENSEAALARTNEELQQFACAASHDLQEPLRTVQIFSEVLISPESRNDESRLREAMTNISMGVSRMRDLIAALLEYSRAGSASESMTSIDSGQVLTETLTTLKGQIEENHAEITFDPLPTIVAGKTQFAQLLQNLLSNAIKYRSRHNPRIEIAAQPAEGDWIFSVRDNGEGIEPRYAGQIFTPFRRLHGHEKPGSGIGLATCQKIVERHGGRIWVESVPGKGSTFFFTIPRTSQASLSAP